MVSSGHKILSVVPVPIAVILLLSACSTTQPESPSPQTTITLTATAAQPSDVGTGTESSTPASAPDFTASSQASKADGEEKDEELLTSVEPEDFRGTDGYDGGFFFLSPSRNLSCGIWLEVGLTGCQSWSLVENLPECDDPMGGSSPAIEFFRDRPADSYCSREGMFWAEARVLQYGERLSVDGVTCMARNTGVTCVEDASGFGFSAAKAGFHPIG